MKKLKRAICPVVALACGALGYGYFWQIQVAKECFHQTMLPFWTCLRGLLE